MVSASTSDPSYQRITASQGVGESAQPQWCEAADSTRFTCRRAKMEQLLTGINPIPATGSCADTTVSSGCQQPASISCTWYDRTLPLAQNPVTQALSPYACLQKMDYRLALIQDTSNRSWPIDDSDGNGQLNDADPWLSPAILRSRALPCPGSSGVIGNQVDWDCNQAIDHRDASVRVYSAWLRDLATQLLDSSRYGALAMNAVLLTQKPVEMGQCQLWPDAERATCNSARHAIRNSAQIQATPSRPLDHYYVPTVYWEHRVIEQVFAEPGLDPRIIAAAPGDPDALWVRSAQCYALGQSALDWMIPTAVPGRPVTIAADDSEVDGTGGTADSAGCMISDHVHHNELGGWMIADFWYRALSGPLWLGLPDPLFADAFEASTH